MLELINGNARLLVDADHGGRIASLMIDGFDVLVADRPTCSPLMWGSYPMAPWAGRIRHGEFSYGGRSFALAPNSPPHAIHGTVFERPWTIAGPREISCDLGDTWPFGGRVLQRFALTPTRLHCTMEVHAGDVTMPAYLGWHPVFVKPDSMDFRAMSMYRRDDEGIPDGTLVSPPPPGPWDDCFCGVDEPISLHWGELVLRLSSDCQYWVVYDREAHATCVEPQSGPPDGLNLAPSTVEPSKPLIKRMTWDWAPLGN